MDFDARKKKCVWKILKHTKEASFGKAEDTFDPSPAWAGRPRISGGALQPQLLGSYAQMKLKSMKARKKQTY